MIFLKWKLTMSYLYLKLLKCSPLSKLEKTLMLGKIEEENGVTEDEMVRRHHWLKGHESEQTLGVGDGQGSLACCSSRGHKESDKTEQLNNNALSVTVFLVQAVHWVFLEAGIWPPHCQKFRFNSDNQGSNSRWTLVIRVFWKFP